MIEHNSEVYNHPYISFFIVHVYMEQDLCRGGLYTSLFCAIIPALFPYFLPFWYPYILTYSNIYSTENLPQSSYGEHNSARHF